MAGRVRMGDIVTFVSTVGPMAPGAYAALVIETPPATFVDGAQPPVTLTVFWRDGAMQRERVSYVALGGLDPRLAPGMSWHFREEDE
jgi:hypothetical protein